MRIFISSVQREFVAERKALAKMIREDRWLSGFFDVFLFEECAAKAKTPQKVYLDAVAESDIYIGLIGGAYGNVDKDGVSPTEREYDKAAELGKDRLMFVKANDDKREDSERQFLGKVSGAVTWHSYDTAAKLLDSVYDALYDWLRDNDLVTNKPFDLSTSRNVQLADLDKSRFEEYKAMVKEAKKVRLGRDTGLMDVREAIVNAVCHRDYASNACVQVMLFRDRLEVINPGSLPKGTTVRDLLISHDSNPRNHVIARAMSWTNYLEKSGSGTGEIIRLCREAGLADPVFESMTGHFKTTIWRRGYGTDQGEPKSKGPSQRGRVEGGGPRVRCKGPVQGLK